MLPVQLLPPVLDQIQKLVNQQNHHCLPRGYHSQMQRRLEQGPRVILRMGYLLLIVLQTYMCTKCVWARC